MEQSISPSTALAMLKSGDQECVLIDVRSAKEFGSAHAEGAIHIPLENILRPDCLERLRNKKVLCICQSGMRGKRAAEALRAEGLTAVSNVEGGTTAWKGAALPLVQGKAAISIERQVRMAAGGLVFVGSLAGLLISPYLLAIPIFVGAGLLFSGITDTCGMAIVLARCPWNR